MADDNDPLDWTVDQVVAFLCHSPSTWSADPSLRPDPEVALKKQRVNGNVLLKGVNEKVLRRREHGQASPWTSVHPSMSMSIRVRPWTLDNKHGRLAPKIGILAISMSPVTLHHFLCLQVTALCYYYCREVSALLF